MCSIIDNILGISLLISKKILRHNSSSVATYDTINAVIGVNMFEIIILQPIFNALLLIYSIIPGGDFGIAVILFTVIIRFLLYPLLKSWPRSKKRLMATVK